MAEGVAYPSIALSSLAPVAETPTPDTGTGGMAARNDHAHPRLTSVTVATVAAGSTVTVPFTRTFTNKPGMVFTEYEGDVSATAQPSSFKVNSWVQDAGNNFIGCVVKVWRSQAVPQNLVTLLLGGIFNLFGASVVGTNFSVIAVARSDV